MANTPLPKPSVPPQKPPTGPGMTPPPKPPTPPGKSGDAPKPPAPPNLSKNKVPKKGKKSRNKPPTSRSQDNNSQQTNNHPKVAGGDVSKPPQKQDSQQTTPPPKRGLSPVLQELEQQNTPSTDSKPEATEKKVAEGEVTIEPKSSSNSGDVPNPPTAPDQSKGTEKPASPPKLSPAGKPSSDVTTPPAADPPKPPVGDDTPPGAPQRPPVSLSALSSMSNNSIPTGGSDPAKPSVPTPPKVGTPPGMGAPPPALGSSEPAPPPPASLGAPPPSPGTPSPTAPGSVTPPPPPSGRPGVPRPIGAPGMPAPPPPVNSKPSNPASEKAASLPSLGKAPPPPGGSLPKGAPGAPDDKPKAKFVGGGNPFLKFLPLIIGALIFIGVLVFVGIQMFGSNSTNNSNSNSNNSSNPNVTNNTHNSSGDEVTIEYWGLWEPTDVMETVFADFESQNPGVSVTYRKQSHKNYRTRLQSAISSGNGPDVFRYHASWVPMLKDELAAMPVSVMSVSEFSETFYPIASQQLQSDGQIVGVPLMYEGLALFYNEEVLQSADISPPTSWSELQQAAQKLTVKQGNTIKRAGVALGNASNVEHFSDIVAVLMLQNGADFTEPNSAETRDALVFYTNFVKSMQVWDDSLPSSSVAFARGDVAMIFAPSWRAFEIQTINPDLKFKTAPVPQIPDATQIGWANYWAEGVSDKSKNKDASWALLKYLSSSEVMMKLHASQSEVRSFGEIHSRMDLAEELLENDKVAAFLRDAPASQSWYLNSYTHDEGINDQMIQYYRDAINALLENEKPEDVLVTLQNGTTEVMRRYRIE